MSAITSGNVPQILKEATKPYKQLYRLICSCLGREVSVVLLEGEPGVGKSHFSRWLRSVQAEIYGECEIIEFQFNDETNREDVLTQVIVSNAVRGIANQPVNQDEIVILSKVTQAVKLSQTKKVVLLLDELDKAPAPVDNFFLSLFEEGQIMDTSVTQMNNGQDLRVNKDNLIIVVTTNGQRKLNEALYRRVIPYIMQFPARKELIKIVEAMLGEDREKIKLEQIKFGVDMMLKYRGTSPKHTMVQNQLVRIIRQMIYNKANDLGVSAFHDDFVTLLSPLQKDVSNFTKQSRKPTEYYASTLWGAKQSKIKKGTKEQKKEEAPTETASESDLALSNDNGPIIPDPEIAEALAELDRAAAMFSSSRSPGLQTRPLGRPTRRRTPMVKTPHTPFQETPRNNF